MTHKRSALSRYRRSLQIEEYLNVVKLYDGEMGKVWAHAYYDREITGALKEIDNTLQCEWVKLEQGEVMIDSKREGTFQREPPEEPLLFQGFRIAP